MRGGCATGLERGLGTHVYQESLLRHPYGGGTSWKVGENSKALAPLEFDVRKSREDTQNVSML